MSLLKKVKARLLATDYGMGMTKAIFEHQVKDKDGKVKTVANKDGVQVPKMKVEEMYFESKLKFGEGQVGESIEINGEQVIFGEGQLACDFGHSGKENKVHKYLAWKSMYDTYKITGDTHFRLAVTCTMSSWEKDKGKKVYEMMMEETTINWDDETTLYIDDVVVFPETLAGALTTNLNLKEEDLIVVDFGTKNLQLLRLLEGTPQKSVSTEKGMDYIYNGLMNLLRIEHQDYADVLAVKKYLKLTSERYEYILKMEKEKGKALTKAELDAIEVGEEFDKGMDEIIKEYLLNNVFTDVEFEKALKTVGYNKYTKYLFLGGGTSYLKRFLDCYFDKKKMNFVPNPFWANVRVLYAKAQAVFRQKDAKAKRLQEQKEAEVKAF